MPEASLSPPLRPTSAAVIKARALAGIAFLVLAVACFAVLDTTTKWVTAEVPLLMAVWVRNLIQALITSAWVLPRKGLSVLKTDHLNLHLVRGVTITAVTLLAFSSLQILPVGEFTAVVMTVPLLVTLLAARLLGEHVSALRIALVAGGFAGVAIIVRPSGGSMSVYMLLPLALVLANTAYQLITSKLTRTEPVLTIQFYTSWVSTLLASIPVYWFWTEISDIQLWLGLLLMGVTGTVGHILMIKAFERAPAATLMPYMYLQIGFAMLCGWIVFKHIPDHLSLLGIGLIALCGIAGALLTLLETRKRI